MEEDMKNYEECIISLCKGETPKEKYEWLIGQLSKLSTAKSFIAGLRDTWDDCSIKTIRSFIEANYDTINRP